MLDIAFSGSHFETFTLDHFEDLIRRFELTDCYRGVWRACCLAWFAAFSPFSRGLCPPGVNPVPGKAVDKNNTVCRFQKPAVRACQLLNRQLVREVLACSTGLWPAP